MTQSVIGTFARVVKSSLSYPSRQTVGAPSLNCRAPEPRFRPSPSLGADQSEVKLGLNATETSVQQTKLDQYRIVYFATHGLVAGDLEKFNKAKAEPALVLTIPDKPTGHDDGLLQASEVAQLKLNADWAVLSACNTATSDGVGAEALSGLARAFLYAGARSLVVSHWDVSDEATTSLMSNLFAKKPYLSHGEALMEATLKLLDDAKTNDDAHPRMWAPFVVSVPLVRLVTAMYAGLRGCRSMLMKGGAGGKEP